MIKPYRNCDGADTAHGRMLVGSGSRVGIAVEGEYRRLAVVSTIVAGRPEVHSAHATRGSGTRICVWNGVDRASVRVSPPASGPQSGSILGA